jgi:hypothetical protein
LRKRARREQLKNQDEEEDLVEAGEKTLWGIRDRDGMKYFREVAERLLENIAFNVEYHAARRTVIRQGRRPGG